MSGAELESAITTAEQALNSRFSDMHKAFQYVDTDKSGTVNGARGVPHFHSCASHARSTMHACPRMQCQWLDGIQSALL